MTRSVPSQQPATHNIFAIHAVTGLHLTTTKPLTLP